MHYRIFQCKGIVKILKCTLGQNRKRVKQFIVIKSLLLICTLTLSQFSIVFERVCIIVHAVISQSWLYLTPYTHMHFIWKIWICSLWQDTAPSCLEMWGVNFSNKNTHLAFKFFFEELKYQFQSFFKEMCSFFHSFNLLY